MRKLRIFILNKRSLFVIAIAAVIVVLSSVTLFYSSAPANSFDDPKSGIIVVDPGHGGVDGGANRDGILEKEVNLAIALKLKDQLIKSEYKVVMTRDRDVSLDNLSSLEARRHQRDLHARADIINSCNAQLFASIHVNCNFNKPATDGSIVFYSDRFSQNRELAYSIQRSLNGMYVNGRQRTIHDPRKGEYYILKYSQIPGVIVETAFISNEEEKGLLLKEEFQEQLAAAIADGIKKYLGGSGGSEPETTPEVISDHKAVLYEGR